MIQIRVITRWVGPKSGSRMMTRVMMGQALRGQWVVVQDGVYRYAVSQGGSTRVRTVLFEHIATEVCWDPESDQHS